MRAQLADSRADIKLRREALETLVRGQDKHAARAFQAAMNEPALRGAAIRALANLDDPQTPQLILQRYAELNDQEKRDAIGTLTVRPAYSLAMLDAIEKGNIPAVDLHAYNVRQILSLNDPALTERLQQVWGAVRETSGTAQEQINRYKELCSPEALEQANPGNGRRIFVATCATCHRLFGEGDQVGPDITGSNRTNLDYILQNIVDPSAVLGNDYRMTVLELVDGRVVSGLIQQESDSAFTVRTLNDTVLIAKSDVEFQSLSPLSMMPEGLLDRMQPQEVRDLIAYLGSPTQVALRGAPPPIDPQTGRVPGALEGESLKLLDKTAGNARSQSMSSFAADHWSGADQLWWTGGTPRDRLTVELPVNANGVYQLDLVLTQAPDYAIVQIYLDDQPLGQPLDLYSAQVVTTGVLEYPELTLSTGAHRLTFEILGAHPQAIKAYMVGLDYLQLKLTSQ
jgi:putative heme-binding domain-containing protein